MADKTNGTKRAKTTAARSTARRGSKKAESPPGPAKTARRGAAALPETARVPRRKQATAPTTEDIACRAYELYIASGCEHGHDLEHWLQAERELRKP